MCVCSVASMLPNPFRPYGLYGALQASLSMGFSRQEYWCELPCLPPRDLPNPETEPASPALQADSLLLKSCKATILQ